MKHTVCRLACAALCAGIVGGMATCAGAMRHARQHKMESESNGVSPIETRVLGQSRWLSGGPASLRVIVTDHRTGKPVEAQVGIALAAMKNGKAEKARRLYAGRAGSLGTVNVSFVTPRLAAGPYQVEVDVKSSIGADRVTANVQLEEATQVMLTADKPLYQPGQTMHLRALALDKATRAAVAGQPITLEIEDARGNKVFKKSETLSKFGLASADFVLANEVNMGVYTLRALLPTGQTEKKVRVERYVLPKFKVGLTTERPYYLPGETVKGTVQSDYFFGKPVAGGQVTLEIDTIDIGVTKLAELQGKTDAAGAYKFEYTLPRSFVGQPFEQGKAVVGLKASVKDTADHTQEANRSVPVVKEPIQLVVVPESRQLVAGVPNRIFLAAATQDGAPLKDADLAIAVNGGKAEHVATDALGVASYQFTPDNRAVTVTVKETAKDGHTATASQGFGAALGAEGILLRTDKTLAKVGDRLTLTALCSAKAGTVYLDVIRNRQTILTKAHAIRDGQAAISIPVTDDMVGTVELHAYKILPDENIIRDTKTIVVSPAEDLVIDVHADSAQYRPGAEALLKFAVRDQGHNAVAAAIGLAVVDESVFALSELQPGLEKIYFTLEKELMEPKVEIHGLKASDLVLWNRRPDVSDAERQRAGALLLAALQPQSDFDIKVNTWQQRWQVVVAKVLQDMEAAQQKIEAALGKFQQATGRPLTAEETLFHLVDLGYLKLDDLRDRWGNFYVTDLRGAPNYQAWFTLHCAGPDGKIGDEDDIVSANYYGLRHRVFRGRMAGGGGFGGGLVEEERLFGMRDNAAVDLMAPAGRAEPLMLGADAASLKSKADAHGAFGPKDGGAAGTEPVRVREYFPETMYWNPALITDERGRAELKLPIADSITTWRMSLMANTADGRLGSGTAPIKVFQDFFADIDLPVSLTQNDRVDIPIAVYNYLPNPQDVTLTMEEQPWFALQGPAKHTVHVEKDEVKVVYFPITVTAIGNHALTVTARGSRLSDAIRRSIDVVPDGKEFRPTINDRLEKEAEKTIRFPESAMDGGRAIWVKLYPGAFSQVCEGLDGLLRMPNGCFEQTSSTTYPNVLVTDYMKQTKRINPELQMKAEQYINIGYQRLVTFEVPGGGFSWFGSAPAHQVLTAYGLLEFGDMAKVHEVDPKLIERTAAWLANKQNPDGTWVEKDAGIAEGIINRQTDALRTSAYIAWALAESGYQGAQIAKGVEYVKAHRGEAKDPYTLALILNLFGKVDRDGEATAEAARALIGMAKTTDKTAWWESDTKTFTGANGAGADLETTGLAAYGLVKWGRDSGFTTKVLTYLVQSKDSFGTWSSTQGTVWSMKALLYASTNGAGGGKGTVTVLANGAKAAEFKITEADSDVMRQVDCAELVKPGENQIELKYDGEGSLLYQIVGRYYVPWNQMPPEVAGSGPLSIGVQYDKTTLAQDDTATVTVTVKNHTDKVAEMPLIDLGIPPGFTVVPDGLEQAVKEKQISKYTVAARQVIVYLEKLDPQSTFTLRYQVKAKYPIRARTPLSQAYPYYNPEQASVSPPQLVTVAKAP